MYILLGVKQIIYLDNSATTKPCKKAIDYMNKALTDNWGNPSSLHILGMNAEDTVNASRKTVAKMLGAKDSEIIFTSCGSEANNMALMSVLTRKNRGNRIITTTIEHPSVLETAKRLEGYGFEVIYLKPQQNGVISLDALKAALNDKTLLVSIMLVNNEIGTIQPIEEAARLTKQLSPFAYFHTDAVQAFGKMPINVTKLGVDMLTASGHKIYAPKGIGLLYKSPRCHIAPFITGGGQEGGMRSGTESVPLIASLQGAVEDLPNLQLSLPKMREIYSYAKELFSADGDIVINSFDEGLPYILNISVPGYRSETLLHFLESREIYVSSGSACAKGNQSYVLKEIGLADKLIDSMLRISFSHTTEKEDIDKLYEALKVAKGQLRKVLK
ncbi:MAG: cysteine desulfurase [Ruminococcaceae bacterium]|nr:cysteine desulfurase [Oscillospiraceae bacterium]